MATRKAGQWSHWEGAVPQLLNWTTREGVVSKEGPINSWVITRRNKLTCQVQVQTRKAKQLKDRTRKRYTYNTAHAETEGPGLNVIGAPAPMSSVGGWRPQVGLVRASKTCWFNDCWTVERPCHCHQAAWVQWSCAPAGEVTALCAGITLVSWLMCPHSCGSLTVEGLLEPVVVSLCYSNGFLLHHFFHFPFEIHGHVYIHDT